MTVRPTPAERLLSMLEEAQTIDALSAEEVRDDLAAFGVDPAPSVAFARALARGDDSPGGRLMGALLAADDSDEIGRLESADIDDVCAQVDRGTAASVAAEARRNAGVLDNIVGLAEKRRRRRRLIVWGGPLAGIAASLLVFAVIMGNAYLKKDEMQVAESITASKPDASDSVSNTYSSPSAEQDVREELRGQQAAPEAEPEPPAKQKKLSDSGSSATGESLALNQSPPASPSVEKKTAPSAEAGAMPEKQEGFAAESEEPPLPRPSEEQPAERREAGEETAEDAENFESLLNTLPLDDEPVAGAPPPESEVDSGLARSVEVAELDDVLVVDPSRVPLLVQSQARAGGGLRQRLDEAQRLAGDRQVIALYRVRAGDRRRDYAQVPLQSGQTQQLAAPSPLIGLLGVEAGRYDFIPLPRR